MKRKRLRLMLSCLMLLTLIGMPLGVVAYQSFQSGMTWRQVAARMFSQVSASHETVPDQSLPKGETLDFIEQQPIGLPFTQPPQISFVKTVDLDKDGLLDVLVCDCVTNTVSWIRQQPQGTFTEQVLAGELTAPAHVHPIDFDGDGDLDIVVAVLGMLFPNNDRIGSVVVLENTGSMRFTKRLLLERIARVSDARAADLDSDGDLDIAVAQFGYDDGETRWLENMGNWQFTTHMLQSLSGPIHAEIADFDHDGKLDIAVLVSQEWEEIYVYAGDGKGAFTPHRVFGSQNPDFGSSGMWSYDLDYFPPHPLPWHGVQWLENQGKLQFAYHRLATMGGAVGARPVDVDHDGDLDIFVFSAFNQWDDPEAQSVMWLENDGKMRFRPHDLANAPTHLQAFDSGDFDGDGQIDLVTGGMHVFKPYDRVERVTLWKNQWKKP